MKIHVFMQGEETTLKMSFVKKLALAMYPHDFFGEYEGKDPYTLDAKISDETNAFLISIKRKDLMTIIVMAMSKKIPIIFYGDKDVKQMSVEMIYFFDKFYSVYNGYYAKEVIPELNQGMAIIKFHLRLALGRNNFADLK